MKESRLMIIVSLCLFVLLGPIFYLLYLIQPNLLDYINIATNLYCGIIVALITSICQYCSAKREIINSIYSAYFDVYRSYYYSKNKSFLWHYNSYGVYKKMIELNPKIVEALDDYHGLLKKYDKTYRKLNPTIKFVNNYKAQNMIKSFLSWFNKKSFDGIFEPLMKEVENILISINRKRFEKDKTEMIRMFNYVWSNSINKPNDD
ncbi:MAG: hypothetical protein ACI4U4_02590 [Bacilli bacterium]